jgi:uncharacterized protein
LYAGENPYIGPTAVLQGVFGRLVAEWDASAYIRRRIVPTSDGALAMGHYTGTFKGTGRPVDAQFARPTKNNETAERITSTSRDLNFSS